MELPVDVKDAIMELGDDRDAHTGLAYKATAMVGVAVISNLEQAAESLEKLEAMLTGLRYHSLNSAAVASARMLVVAAMDKFMSVADKAETTND